MTQRPRRSAAHIVLALVAMTASAKIQAQAVSVSLSASDWEGSDSVRSETYLGRSAIYINRGVALARGVALENGAIDYDVAAAPTTSFLGLAFRAASPEFSEVILLRPRQSGTPEALQYAPAFNNVAAAWQVYHGPESNAVVTIPRERWVHVRIELEGPTARVYFDTATAPTLTVPRIAGGAGARFGVWTGAFGRGAYFSNIRITPSPKSAAAAGSPRVEPGVIANWELSNIVEPAAFTPTKLPNLAQLKWQGVTAEGAGFVLVNRYREQPNGGVPQDPTSHEVLVDSVMTGKAAGSRIVYARTTIDSPRDEVRRMQYCYSDGVVIYLNGRPLVFAMNPPGLRDNLGIMARTGDAVYLPLRHGKNELVFAVVEFTGGWAFGARLDGR